MDSSELYDIFREDVRDTKKPYLWTDAEVWRYMNAAYRMFVRLVGGISDFTSDAASVQITAGDPLAALHPSILRVMRAQRRSDGGKITIINETDLDSPAGSRDYGQVKSLTLDNTPGIVRFLMIGSQKNVGRWLQVPAVDDTADLMIYRLPLGVIDGPDQALDEVEEDHHTYLLDWMRHLAYQKKDADTFDPNASAQGEAAFRAYCSQVKAENERYKAKVRTVSYGGL